MKMRNQICLLLTTLLASTTFAHQLYRHVPFSAEISNQDNITIDYSLANSAGITCISNSRDAIIHYTYRGVKKQAKLPVILQSRVAPNKPREILADSEGQFRLRSDDHKKISKFSCQHLIPG